MVSEPAKGSCRPKWDLPPGPGLHPLPSFRAGGQSRLKKVASLKFQASGFMAGKKARLAA